MFCSNLVAVDTPRPLLSSSPVFVPPPLSQFVFFTASSFQPQQPPLLPPKQLTSPHIPASVSRRPSRRRRSMLLGRKHVKQTPSLTCVIPVPNHPGTRPPCASGAGGASWMSPPRPPFTERCSIPHSSIPLTFIFGSFDRTGPIALTSTERFRRNTTHKTHTRDPTSRQTSHRSFLLAHYSRFCSCSPP